MSNRAFRESVVLLNTPFRPNVALMRALARRGPQTPAPEPERDPDERPTVEAVREPETSTAPVGRPRG